MSSSPSVYLKISRNLKIVREKLGLTEQQAADYCLVSPRTYAGWEAGKPMRSSGPISRLEAITGVNLITRDFSVTLAVAAHCRDDDPIYRAIKNHHTATMAYLITSDACGSMNDSHPRHALIGQILKRAIKVERAATLALANMPPLTKEGSLALISYLADYRSGALRIRDDFTSEGLEWPDDMDRLGGQKGKSFLDCVICNLVAALRLSDHPQRRAA